MSDSVEYDSANLLALSEAITNKERAENDTRLLQLAIEETISGLPTPLNVTAWDKFNSIMRKNRA